MEVSCSTNNIKTTLRDDTIKLLASVFRQFKFIFTPSRTCFFETSDIKVRYGVLKNAKVSLVNFANCDYRSERLTSKIVQANDINHGDQYNRKDN